MLRSFNFTLVTILTVFFLIILGHERSMQGDFWNFFNKIYVTTLIK